MEEEERKQEITNLKGDLVSLSCNLFLGQIHPLNSLEGNYRLQSSKQRVRK